MMIEEEFDFDEWPVSDVDDNESLGSDGIGTILKP
jgi:hypothetical protein